MQPPVTRPSIGAAVAAALMLFPLIAPAAPPAKTAADQAALQRQIDALQKSVRQLQKRLHELEARPAPATVPAQPGVAAPATPAPAGSAPVRPGTAKAELTPQIRENWGNLKHGMTRAQVRALLGPPSRKLDISGQPLWYYYYLGTGGGSVMFSRSGTVLSWQHPPSGWLW